MKSLFCITFYALCQFRRHCSLLHYFESRCNASKFTMTSRFASRPSQLLQTCRRESHRYMAKASHQFSTRQRSSSSTSALHSTSVKVSAAAIVSTIISRENVPKRSHFARKKIIKLVCSRFCVPLIAILPWHKTVVHTCLGS